MDVARLLSTWFGAGRSPWAPGTAGTLAAVPLYLLLVLAGHAAWTVPAAAALVAGLGIAVSGRYAARRGVKDPPEVVIDEVAGYLTACSFTPPGWVSAVAAFALFRAFDIAKPWPIGRLQRLPGGWGIVVDDLAAGLVSGGLLRFGWALATLWGGAAGAPR